METIELHNALVSNPHTAAVVTWVGPRDMLPVTVRRKPAGIIVNTHKSIQPGQHWVAMYIGKDAQGYYFDSYGLPPMYTEFKDFMKRNASSFKYNKIRVQGVSEHCGMYCLYFLMCMIRQKKMHFTNPGDNDRWIQQWMKDTFA